MPPFRLFGRPPEPEPTSLGRAADDAVSWAPGPWSADPVPAARHARPAVAVPAPGVHDDPPTDPHGFPPVPGPEAGAWPVPPPAIRRPAQPAVVPPPDPQEAAALAGAFAADYLSWDEDDPARRGKALADHLAAPTGDAALLGWDGQGRQRAEFALPGLVRPDGYGRVLVDVRVRVTPYRAVGDRTDDRLAEVAELEPDVPGVPAAAPAPTGRGWRGCASYWIRLSVPVVRDDGRLLVDAAEEVPGRDTAPVRAPDPDRGYRPARGSDVERRRPQAWGVDPDREETGPDDGSAATATATRALPSRTAGDAENGDRAPDVPLRVPEPDMRSAW